MPLSNHVNYDPAERESRLLCDDPQATAYAWIKRYALNLSRENDPDCDNDYYTGTVTADELIEEAMAHVRAKGRGPLFDGVSIDPVFWDKLAVLKGIEIPS